MAEPLHLFWDSCVFSAYLREEVDIYDVDSIDQFLAEARDGKWVIHTSTVASLEVLPSQIVKVGIGSFEDFLEDYSGAVVPFDPSPNVMQLSGALRDLPYSKSGSKKRRLTAADSMMLASAVLLRDGWGIDIHKFHTFDKGGKKDIEGNNSIPLLGYETWCEGFGPEQMRVAQKVIDLDRCRPDHPSPKFSGMG